MQRGSCVGGSVDDCTGDVPYKQQKQWRLPVARDRVQFNASRMNLRLYPSVSRRKGRVRLEAGLGLRWPMTEAKELWVGPMGLLCRSDLVELKGRATGCDVGTKQIVF